MPDTMPAAEAVPEKRLREIIRTLCEYGVHAVSGGD